VYVPFIRDFLATRVTATVSHPNKSHLYWRRRIGRDRAHAESYTASRTLPGNSQYCQLFEPVDLRDLPANVREIREYSNPVTFVLIAETYRGGPFRLLYGIVMPLLRAAFLSDAEHREFFAATHELCVGTVALALERNRAVPA
jgi:hypothetical protein